MSDTCRGWGQQQCQSSEGGTDPSSVAHSFANLNCLSTCCLLQLSPEVPALESFGRSDPADPEDLVRKKGRVNSWTAQEWSGAEAVCALGMLPRSSRSVCLENHPWLKEIHQARYESRRVGEIKSVFEDQLSYWA